MGDLVMVPAYLPRRTQEYLEESPDCDEIAFDEHTDDIVSLLEENARLRGLVVKLSELVLRNVVDGR
jgi:hypothetical protein